MVMNNSFFPFDSLPPPTILDVPDEIVLRDTWVAKLKIDVPEWTNTVESDPLYKTIENIAYRFTVQQRYFNAKALQLFVAYADGANLDQHAAQVGITRNMGEIDSILRQRIPNRFNAITAGAPEPVRSQAREADNRVIDAQPVLRPNNQDYNVYLMSSESIDGRASDELVIKVKAYLDNGWRRPLWVKYFVQTGIISAFTILIDLKYDSRRILGASVGAASRQALYNYLTTNFRLGQPIYRNAIVAAATVPGVAYVDITSPAIDLLPPDNGTAYFCKQDVADVIITTTDLNPDA